METITEHSRIDYLIELYLSGEIDRVSLAELKKLSVISEANRSYVKERLEVWFSSGMVEQMDTRKLDNKFQLIEQRIETDESVGKNPFRIYKKWIGWAVAVVIILLLPLGGYWWGLQDQQQLLSDISLETAMGARTKVYLPDSTLVWLNTGSHLTYSTGYGIKNRKITLQGEALFDVRHNEKLPFEINAKDVDLKVLGTRFVFSDYPEDDNVTVDLVRGKVFLVSHTRKEQMYLSPNERMLLDKKTGRMQKQAIDATLSGSWTQGRLFFDEVSLAEIAKELSRSYNVRITVVPSMQDDSFYGSFDMRQNSVEDILRNIASTKQMRYRYKNGEYILY